MELAYGGGLPLVPELAAAGKQVFLDLKLHDIPNTVERATAQAAKLGARFLTVHAYPQTMRAAVAGAKGSGTQILAVTVLTSYDDADLFDACYRFGVVETVRRRAEQARDLGVDGLVASAAEAAMVAPDGRRGDASCHPRHPARGRSRRRPEARRDARRGDPQRRRLSRRWPAGDRGARPARRRGGDRGGDRSGADLIGREAELGSPAAIEGGVMPKGYVIARVDVTNPEAYARYAAAATKAIADHGGRPLARGGRSEALEGKARARNVVLEFDSYDAARRYYYSEQYQAARRRCAKARRRSKWFWSRESKNAEGLLDRACRRDAIPRFTRNTSQANARRLRQIRGALPCPWRKARRRQRRGGRATS